MYIRVSVLFSSFGTNGIIKTLFVVLSGWPLGTDGSAEVVKGMSSKV